VIATLLGPLDGFVDGTATRRVVGDRAIVVVRIGSSVYALDDRCSHEDFPLSEGEVDVDTCEIECERHGAMFDLTDGSPVSFPATRPVPTYEVTVESGMVSVAL
jgi:3-phenylpropionate/trans-cinnamate dioxygenase ferredoxin component